MLVFSGKRRQRRNKYLPANILGLVCGKTGSGKTNLVLNLLLNDEFKLKYDEIYICTPTQNQNAYDKVAEYVSGVVFVDPWDLEKFNFNNEFSDRQKAFVFDDVVTMPNKIQRVIQTYFSMGRHKKFDMYYLSQNYISIDRELIRSNANVLFIFKQRKSDLQTIFRDLITWTDSDDFIKSVTKITKEQYQCAVVNLEDETVMNAEDLIIDKKKDRQDSVEESKIKYVYYGSPEDLKKRLEIILGEIEAGNDETGIEELKGILDEMLDKKLIDKKTYLAFNDKYELDD